MSPAQLTIINGAEPESLDPQIITGQPEYRVCQALGEGLTCRNGRGQVEPGLAESWEVSPDGKVYTFHLRDATWSNGEPIIAQDFSQSWERALNPKLGSQYTELFYPVQGAQEYNEGKLKDFSQVGVKVLDEHQLQVTLRNVTPFFLDLCSLPTLQPVYLPGIQRWGDNWIKPGKLVSCGAYCLLDWRINDRISLQKNPRYWRAAQTKIDRIDLLPVNQATTAFNLFYSRVADLIVDKGLIPSFFVAQIAHEPYFHSGPYLGVYFYRFNVNRKPLTDLRVRKALAMSLDRARLVGRVTHAGERIADGLTPPGIPGYESVSGLGFNLQEARRLLAEAGYPEGAHFPVLSILYNSSEQDEQMATALQAMWKENLGITVQLRNQQWKVYLNTLESEQYDICRSSWVGDYCDPNTFLDMFVTNRGNNRTGWSSPRYDQLISQAQAEVDLPQTSCHL